jgi:hypothetical protein
MVENLYCSHICRMMNEFLNAKFLRMYVLCPEILSRVSVTKDGIRIINWIC